MDPFIVIIGRLPILIGISLALELASAKILFERKWYKEYLEGKGLKAPVVLGLAWIICYSFDFDIFSVILSPAEPQSTGFGILLTAAVTAGGRALTMFQEIMRLRGTTLSNNSVR